MIPTNDATEVRQISRKELSWMDRMQLKLESLCEMDPDRNSNTLLQETSNYLESQIATVGTNMRKFCAEFVKELLLTPSVEKTDITQVDEMPAKADQRQITLEHADPVLFSSCKLPKLLESSLLMNEGEATIMMSVFMDQDVHLERAVKGDDDSLFPAVEAASYVEKEDGLSALEVTQESIIEGGAHDDDEQSAHWFVGEEYRKMRLEKAGSMSFLNCGDGHQRSFSEDSLTDWELL